MDTATQIAAARWRLRQAKIRAAQKKEDGQYFYCPNNIANHWLAPLIRDASYTRVRAPFAQSATV